MRPLALLTCSYRQPALTTLASPVRQVKPIRADIAASDGKRNVSHHLWAYSDGVKRAQKTVRRDRIARQHWRLAQDQHQRLPDTDGNELVRSLRGKTLKEVHRKLFPGRGPPTTSEWADEDDPNAEEYLKEKVADYWREWIRTDNRYDEEALMLRWLEERY